MSNSPPVEHECADPSKGLFAGFVSQKAIVSQAWIAEHLGMKNAADVSRVIHRMGLSRIEEKVPATLREFVFEKMK